MPSRNSAIYAFRYAAATDPYSASTLRWMLRRPLANDQGTCAPRERAAAQISRHVVRQCPLGLTSSNRLPASAAQEDRSRSRGSRFAGNRGPAQQIGGLSRQRGLRLPGRQLPCHDPGSTRTGSWRPIGTAGGSNSYCDIISLDHVVIRRCHARRLVRSHLGRHPAQRARRAGPACAESCDR